ncbi:DUF4440 domain-containing protein [Kineococcus sp. R8]|uniref:nuclear transport factor 2 family protein n=1 Tax=Kineococcus siccus TaxID=2696567 RepID=UPI0014133D33|nr:nuclear transport factor 2 family protein [Kineococcus siccus]NAZ83271.1 DUF4440 domain-containing protein [Kineococcus siccus]
MTGAGGRDEGVTGAAGGRTGGEAPPDGLDGAPAVVASWVRAQVDGDVGGQLALSAPDVEVVDDGRTHLGRDQVEVWARRARGEFRYRTTVLDWAPDGEDVVVRARLDGDFPGATVVLRYRFTLAGELVRRVVIAV